ncbi:flagellar hook-length control protein FliK [Uliginosibacterium flavum]|uniref:Flagellar hook-length control protein FliK n=1 Tax=Uliginosibacterium flavum TaxID=1396831 RepID=A0ABV2TNA3_9RHOO
MATVNTPALAAIAPVAPRNPAAQNAPQQAEQDGKPTFAQVLKSRSQTPEASKPGAKTDGPRDKADTRNAAQAADETDAATAAALATQANNTAPTDPALLLVAAGLNPAPVAPSTSSPGSNDTGTALGAETDASRDTSLFATSTAAFAAQAASLAGKANNSADNASKNQAGLASSGILPGEADGKPLSSQGDADSEIRSETLKASADPLADKLAAGSQTEKSSSFATELANASQNQASSSGTLATHGVLSGPQAGRSGEALPQHEISTPVATRGWAEEVGQKVSWIASRDNGRAEIVLTPPSMGRVEISISMNGDQASATFITASPAAREALQDAMPRLREVLAQSGIQLGQANVNEGSTQQQAQNDNSGRRSAASRFASPAELSQVPVGSTSGSWTGRGSGAIDTFA